MDLLNGEPLFFNIPPTLPPRLTIRPRPAVATHCMLSIVGLLERAAALNQINIPLNKTHQRAGKYLRSVAISIGANWKLIKVFTPRF